MPDLLDVLVEARNLIGVEDKWIQNTERMMFLKVDGTYYHAYCAYGAIIAATRKVFGGWNGIMQVSPIFNELRSTLGAKHDRLFGYHSSIYGNASLNYVVAFNDTNPYESVIEMFDTTIARLTSQREEWRQKLMEQRRQTVIDGLMSSSIRPIATQSESLFAEGVISQTEIFYTGPSIAFMMSEAPSPISFTEEPKESIHLPVTGGSRDSESSRSLSMPIGERMVRLRDLSAIRKCLTSKSLISSSRSPPVALELMT